MKNDDKPRRRPGRPYSGGRDPARSIRVSDDDWSVWKAVAEQRGVSIAELIRRSMAKYSKKRKGSK